MRESRGTSLVLVCVRMPIICVLLSACGEQSREPSVDRWQGTMDTLANGIVRVTNPSNGLWTEAERWHIVEELRIGAPEGETPDAFGSIADLNVGPSSEILVLEAQAQEIRVFDSKGHHLRTFGGKGGGPGELGQAFGLAWDFSHRLWVADAGNGRYSVFDSAGVCLTSHPRPTPGVVFPWLGGFTQVGKLIDVAPRPDPSGAVQFVFYGMDADGTVRDTFPALHYRPPPRPDDPLPLPIALLLPRMTFRLDPRGYIWFGTTDRYELSQRSLSGDTLRVVQRPLSPSRIGPAEKDSLVRAVGESPIPITRAQVPDHWPLFERLHVDDRGHVWVQRLGAAGDPGQLFDVFDPEGRFLGPVRSDVRFESMPPLLIKGDQVLGVTRDELDVPYAVRARIERPQD